MIDPRWFDQPQDVRDRISGVLKNSKLISDPVDFASNPWANETLSQILRGGKPRDANSNGIDDCQPFHVILILSQNF